MNRLFLSCLFVVSLSGCVSMRHTSSGASGAARNGRFPACGSTERFSGESRSASSTRHSIGSAGEAGRSYGTFADPSTCTKTCSMTSESSPLRPRLGSDGVSTVIEYSPIVDAHDPFDRTTTAYASPAVTGRS